MLEFVGWDAGRFLTCWPFPIVARDGCAVRTLPAGMSVEGLGKGLKLRSDKYYDSNSQRHSRGANSRLDEGFD